MDPKKKVLIAQLNKLHKFPCKIAFNLIRDTAENTNIISTVIKTSAKVENIKYLQARSETWTSLGSAVLSVKEYKSAEEYFDEMTKMHNLWGFAIRKGEVKKEEF